MNILAPLTTARKASVASIGGASLVAIPQVQQVLDVLGLLLAIQTSKGLLWLGLPQDKLIDTTDLWKWLLAALMLHLAVYLTPNAPQPPAVPAESPDHA